MLNFQGTVYIKNGFCLKITIRGGSILSVNPGSVLIINQHQKTFGEKVNSERCFRLSEALVAADIMYEDGAHDGLVDAYNTALLFTKMEKETELSLNPYYRNVLLGSEEEERCCSTLGSLFGGIDISVFAVA